MWQLVAEKPPLTVKESLGKPKRSRWVWNKIEAKQEQMSYWQGSSITYITWKNTEQLNLGGEPLTQIIFFNSKFYDSS